MLRAYWSRVFGRAHNETWDMVQPHKGLYGVSLALLGSVIGVAFFGVHEATDYWRVAASGGSAVVIGYAVMFLVHVVRVPALLEYELRQSMAALRNQVDKFAQPLTEGVNRRIDRLTDWLKARLKTRQE